MIMNSQAEGLTLSALAGGLVIGTVMCFSNMYFGLQTGWVTMGSLQSAILGFGLFRLLHRLGLRRSELTLAENVLIQTTSVATATMPLAAGLVGVIPAMAELTPEENPPDGGILLPWPQLLLWSTVLAFFGVFVAVPLREQTIVREELRFPSGTATAQVLEVLHEPIAPRWGRTQEPEGKAAPQTLDNGAAADSGSGFAALAAQPLPDAGGSSSAGGGGALSQRSHSTGRAWEASWRPPRASARAHSLPMDLPLLGVPMSPSKPVLGRPITRLLSLGWPADPVVISRAHSLVLADISSPDGEAGGAADAGAEAPEAAAPLDPLMDAIHSGSSWKAFLASFLAALAHTGAGTWLPALASLNVLALAGLRCAGVWGWTLSLRMGYVGQGMLMGPRTTWSMMAGAVVGWAVLGPLAAESGWTQDSAAASESALLMAPSASNASALAAGREIGTPDGEPLDICTPQAVAKAGDWLVWPALAIMLADSMTSLLLLFVPQLLERLRDALRRRGTRAPETGEAVLALPLSRRSSSLPYPMLCSGCSCFAPHCLHPSHGVCLDLPPVREDDGAAPSGELPRNSLPQPPPLQPPRSVNVMQSAFAEAATDWGAAETDAAPERAPLLQGARSAPSARDRADAAAETAPASADVPPEADGIPASWWLPGLAVSSLLCCLAVSRMFAMPPLQPLVALLLAMLVAVLAVRALGETDLNPVSGVGKLSQLVFALIAPGQVVANLVAGAVAEAGAQQAGDMMQDFKTAYLLGVSARAQLYAMLLGSGASVAVSVAAYQLFNTAYTIGGSVLPAPTARVWLNMARLVNGGHLPQQVVAFGAAGMAAAVLLQLVSLLCKRRLEGAGGEQAWLAQGLVDWLPSGVAFAVGMYIRAEFTIPRLLGTAAEQLWLALHPASHSQLMMVVASGLVLGEGIASVLGAAARAVLAH